MGRPKTRQALLLLSRTQNLAGTEAARTLSNLLLADGDDVDLEVVELFILG